MGSRVQGVNPVNEWETRPLSSAPRVNQRGTFFNLQVMVFVHARNATVKTALTLREMAANQGDAALFHAQQTPEYGAAEKQVYFRRILLGSISYPVEQAYLGGRAIRYKLRHAAILDDDTHRGLGRAKT